jgi:hypothetical protein
MRPPNEGTEHTGQELRLCGIRITPALVLSIVALFAALSTTGFAASIVPLAKHALTADKAKVATKANNALKLEGATAAQVAAIPGPGTDAQTLNGQTAAQIAATPGPTSSLSNSLFTYRTESFELSAEGATSRVTANCQAGERAVGGGWEQVTGIGYVLQDSPNSTNTGWRFVIYGESGNNLAAVGNVWVVCAKVG